MCTHVIAVYTPSRSTHLQELVEHYSCSLNDIYSLILHIYFLGVWSFQWIRCLTHLDLHTRWNFFYATLNNFHHNDFVWFKKWCFAAGEVTHFYIEVSRSSSSTPHLQGTGCGQAQHGSIQGCRWILFWCHTHSVNHWLSSISHGPERKSWDWDTSWLCQKGKEKKEREEGIQWGVDIVVLGLFKWNDFCFNFFSYPLYTHY